MHTPDQLITNGVYNYGRYTQPIKDLNLHEANVSFLAKKFQLREWQAFQLHTEGYFVMIALYNTKKICIVQFIVYDIHNNEKYTFEKKVFPWQVNVAKGLYKTSSSYSDSHSNIHAFHDLDKNVLTIEAEIKKGKKHPAIHAKLIGDHNVNRFTPIVTCMPFSENKGMYSHKCLMPVEGFIQLGETKIEFNFETSSLIIDDHKGYYPYVTKYDWITGMGFNRQGNRIGFNFTDNQVKDQEAYNENGIWLDGKLSFLPPVKVTRPDGYKNTWFIKDKKGRIDLTFNPIVHNSVYVHAGILKSKYEGPYGYFNGYIFDNSENKIPIENIFGMGEGFYLRS